MASELHAQFLLLGEILTLLLLLDLNDEPLSEGEALGTFASFSTFNTATTTYGGCLILMNFR